MPSWEAVFDLAGKAAEKKQLEDRLSDPAIWNHPQAAGAMGSRVGQLRRVLEAHASLASALRNLAELIELAEGEQDAASRPAIESGLASSRAATTSTGWRPPCPASTTGSIASSPSIPAPAGRVMRLGQHVDAHVPALLRTPGLPL
ncbi:hypothetical protein HS125_17485 [bacterium]|nr:hypothetical protein [bacterium]